MLALALTLAAAQDIRVEPRSASYEEMRREVFDVLWIVPSGLPLDPEGVGAAWELEVELPQIGRAHV